MQDRTLRVLEFHKIREMLRALAVSELGKERIDQLVPASDERTVRLYQQQTEEASVVMAYTGSNPMPAVPDVRAHLKRAGVGATLNPKALLEVGEALRAARSARDSLVTDRENTPLITGLASGLSVNRPLEEDIFDAILS